MSTTDGSKSSARLPGAGDSAAANSPAGSGADLETQVRGKPEPKSGKTTAAASAGSSKAPAPKSLSTTQSGGARAKNATAPAPKPVPTVPASSKMNPPGHVPGDNGPPDAADDNGDEFGDALGGFLSTVPAWLISMVFHIGVLLILALLTMQGTQKDRAEVSLHQGDDPSKLESTETDIPTLDEADRKSDELQALKIETKLDSTIPTQDLTDPSLAASNIPLPDFKTDLSAAFNPDAMPSTLIGDALVSRGAGARNALLASGGGTPESERAVAMALEWLSNHQYPDGSWSFDHRHAQRCNNQCSAAGIISTRQPDSPNAATALGLLPFLGAGFTHKEGKYKSLVQKGLNYLISTQKPDGSWMEGSGTMYSHGLCAITMCEAYAMTQDPELRDPAQKSISFIEYAQDKVGGGWRYVPGMAGDTSVVGWQVMALKSAQMAYLRVDPNTIVRAESFLDSVSRESGSVYGYQQPGATKTLTAVGLLCRMYMGWKQDYPALARGVQFLAEQGPDTLSNDVYYNYYATQVLRHFDGPLWTNWNENLREHLIKTQEQRDHARGSWYSEGSYNKTGGRHYTTALSCMTLEVYYRHMPLYKKESNLGFDVGDAFKAGGDDKDKKDDAAQGDGNQQGGNQDDMNKGDTGQGGASNGEANKGDGQRQDAGGGVNARAGNNHGRRVGREL